MKTLSDDNDPNEFEQDGLAQSPGKEPAGEPAVDAAASSPDGTKGMDAAAEVPDGASSVVGDQGGSSGVIRGDVGSETAQVWISAFLIAALGFLVYLNAFNVPLHGDDLTLYGEGTPMGRISTSLEALPQMPTAPLSVLGLALNGALGGDNLDMIHGASILLHILCGVLVFFIARRLLPSSTPVAVSMVAGMFFVVHPVTAEPVNYLVARSVLQSTFFGLLGLVLLLRGWGPKGRQVRSLILAVVSFVLAFGSDSSALIFPSIGCVLVYFQGAIFAGPRDYRGVVASVLLLATAFMGVAGAASGLFSHAVIDDGVVASVSNVIAQAGYGLVYGGLPTAYSLLPVAGGLALGLVGLILLAGLIAAGLAKDRLVASVGFWIFLSLIGIGFFGAGEGVGPTRYLYGPWAGICLLAPWLIQRFSNPQLRGGAGMVATVLILSLSALSFQRSAQWTQPQTLWAAEAEAHPESIRPDLERGRYFMAQLNTLPLDNDSRSNFLNQAKGAWEGVVASSTDHVAEARKSLGVIAMEQQAYVEAREHLQFAATHLPRDQDVAIFYAYAAEQAARAAGEQEGIIEALRSLKRARSMGDLPQMALERYGLLAVQVGDVETGLPLLERAATVNPSEGLNETIQRARALAEQRANLVAQANAAREADPNSGNVLLLQAQRNLLEGQTMKAYYLLQMIMARDSGNVAAWTQLGITCARIDGANNFLAEWGGQVSDWEAWRQLGFRCAGLGAWSAAETYLRHGARQPLSNAPMPELALADIALEFKQAQRAVAYLQAAQQAYPDQPAPWLRLAEMALASGDKNSARKLVEEAEKRQADPAAVKALKDQLGAAPTQGGVTRTVIQ